MYRMYKNFLNSIASMLARDLITGLGQIALMPIFLIRFGKDNYTTWLTILSYTSCIVLADFGMATVIIHKLIFSIENMQGFNLNLWNWFKRRTLSFALILTALIALFYFPREPFRNSQFNFFDLNIQLFIALAVSSIITIYQHFWLYKLQIFRKANLGQANLSTLRIIEVFSLAVLLQFNLLLSQFAWLFVLIKLAAFACLRAINRKIEYPSISCQSIDKSGIFRPALGNALITTSNVISLHGSFIFASFWLHPRELISIAIARMLSSPIRTLGTAIASSSLPYLIRNNVTRSRAINQSIALYSILKWSIIGISTLTFTLLFLSEPIWEFLSHGLISYDRNLVFWFCMATLADSIQSLIFQKSISRNTSLSGAFVYLCATVIMTGLQEILGNFFGILAVPLCILLADIIIIFYLGTKEWKNAI